MPVPQLADVLRAKGLRLTAQRQLVLEAVLELGHATPEQIHDKVVCTAAGVNITTIYRTLELLEGLGLVAHTHLGHGAPVYHGAGDRGHVHLVCHRCGKVDEVSPDIFGDVRSRLLAERGFLIDIGHVALFGMCSSCNEEDSPHDGIG